MAASGPTAGSVQDPWYAAAPSFSWMMASRQARQCARPSLVQTTGTRPKHRGGATLHNLSRPHRAWSANSASRAFEPDSPPTITQRMPLRLMRWWYSNAARAETG